MKSLSRREQILLIALVFVALPYGWWQFRWSPGRASEETLRRAVTTAETQLTSARSRLETAADRGFSNSAIRRSRAKLVTLYDQLEDRRSDLATEEARFAKLSDPAVAAQLRLDLSTLAADHDVLVLSRGIASDRSDEESLLTRRMSGDFYDRPQQRVTIRSTYFAVRKFVAALESLSTRVTLVSFEIESDRDSTTHAPLGTVTSTLVLAL